MTNAELQEALSKLPPDMPVGIYRFGGRFLNSIKFHVVSAVRIGDDADLDPRVGLEFGPPEDVRERKRT